MTQLRLALVVLAITACVAARATVTHAATARATAHKIALERMRIVKFARKFIGVPYRYGGTSPATGFDCSGFTRFVYAHFGFFLPHYSGSQFSLGRSVSLSSLRPGDLVFSYGLGHVGIYAGHGMMIHAPHTGRSVELAPLSWVGFDGARRLVA